MLDLLHNQRKDTDAMDNSLAFFKEFFKHPRQLGTTFPSTRILHHNIVDIADVSSANVVVELGPGTGGTTAAILRSLPQNAKLLSIEVNSRCYDIVNSIDDPRHIAHYGNASELREALLLYNLDSPDVIISGIPFSNISYTAGSKIVEEISALLAPDGCFVAYQASKRVLWLSKNFFKLTQKRVVLWNIPPILIYRMENI